MSSPALQKNIITTLAYYDVMDFPMTSFEVWKYLTRIAKDELLIAEEDGYSLANVIKELEGEKLKNFIEQYRGFYFLKGRRELVEKRLERNKISEAKFKLLRKIVWWLRFSPYVRMIAVTGRMAMKNTEAGSDLDLLVVYKKGKIFTGRFFLTLLTHILGKRRHKDKIKNRICLNHHLTEEFCVSIKDIFSAHEYSFLLPIFKADEAENFYRNNEWIKNYKINYCPEEDNLKIIKDGISPKIIRIGLEKLLVLGNIEKYLKKLQLEKINRNPNTRKAGSMIICNDQELAFWPNFENQGPKIFAEFKKRLDKIANF